jgi:hypothetical protein
MSSQRADRIDESQGYPLKTDVIFIYHRLSNWGFDVWDTIWYGSGKAARAVLELDSGPVGIVSQTNSFNKYTYTHLGYPTCPPSIRKLEQ